MVLETGVQSEVKSNQRFKKWYLIPPSLTPSMIRYVSRVKWKNPEEGVVPSPTPRSSSHWKRSLRVALDYGHQLYLLVVCLASDDCLTATGSCWGLVGRVFSNGQGDRGSIPGRVIPMTQKGYLIPSCLILSLMRYVWRVKWSNPGKEVVPSPTPRSSSYWKESLWVAFDYSH